MKEPIVATIFLAVLFCSFSAMAQQLNDDRANATLLTADNSCVMQPFDSENQTAKPPRN